MSAYFPYSHIILNICNNIHESISKHTYFGEWGVCAQTQPAVKIDIVGISEIYY